MSRIPRLLPVVGVAIGGVLAIQVITQAPSLLSATRAFAEDVVTPKAKPAVAPTASILNGPSASASKPPAPACAPTAAELAKEAGLSPAELQVLQSLSDRRSQLDQRDHDLDTQVELIAAAEAKLDARIQQMNGLKTDIQGLIGQANQQQQAEQLRLVRVYEDMDPKKAAAAMTLLDDSVRVPIAAAMKERKLADVLAKMDPADAKALTEKLAQRVAGSPALANAEKALNPQAAADSAAGAPATAANTPPAGQTPPQQTAQANTAAPAAPPRAAKPRRGARSRLKAKPAPASSADLDQTAAASGQTTKAAAAPPKPAVPPSASPGPTPAKSG